MLVEPLWNEAFLLLSKVSSVHELEVMGQVEEPVVQFLREEAEMLTQIWLMVQMVIRL